MSRRTPYNQARVDRAVKRVLERPDDNEPTAGETAVGLAIALAGIGIIVGGGTWLTSNFRSIGHTIDGGIQHIRDFAWSVASNNVPHFDHSMNNLTQVPWQCWLAVGTLAVGLSIASRLREDTAPHEPSSSLDTEHPMHQTPAQKQYADQAAGHDAFVGRQEAAALSREPDLANVA